MKSVSVTAVAWQETAESGVRETAGRAQEAEWVTRSRAGDLDAFSFIYKRYEAAVFRHAYRLLENTDEADDVRQETFVRAYQSLNRFRGDASLKTYLYAICGNLCRDRLRHARRHPERGYGLTVPEEAMPLTETGTDTCQNLLAGFERATDAARIQNALSRLAPGDREIVLLRHVEGMELDDIAAIVGCTRVSAPVRLFRARRRLKDIFLSLIKEEGE